MANQPMVRITKQFRFEAAHALWNYDGQCRNIHGHSYILYVTIKGRPVNDLKNPKHGMVIDFSQLKNIVNELIIEPFDHALMVNAHTPHLQMAKNNSMFGKVTAVPYQPTCENMVCDFAKKIKSALPEGIRLHSIRLHETSTAFAEWFEEDNN